MRPVFTSVLALSIFFGPSSASAQQMLASYPTSAASVTYARQTDQVTASLPAASPDDEAWLAAGEGELMDEELDIPVVLPGMLAVKGNWPTSAGPLTVEVLDMLNRPVVRQTRTRIYEECLVVPVPMLPADHYIVRVLDAHGSQLHRETVAYTPGR